MSHRSTSIFKRSEPPSGVETGLMVLLILFVVLTDRSLVFAEDHLSVKGEQAIRAMSFGESLLNAGATSGGSDLLTIRNPFRMDLPLRSRVTRSVRPVRWIELVGGDCFAGEVCEWKADSLIIRLLDDQLIRIPANAVSHLRNPPGELDLVDESFEEISKHESNRLATAMIREGNSSGGQHSLRVDSNSSGFHYAFESPLSSARIEFSFFAKWNDLAADCGEWELSWSNHDSVVIRRLANGSLGVSNRPAGMGFVEQPLRLGQGWHRFIALITPDRTRLIVDDSILAAFPTPESTIQSIRIRPLATQSKNEFRIDDFQIRRLNPPSPHTDDLEETSDSDRVLTASGDSWFGHIASLNRLGVTLHANGQVHSIPWIQLKQLSWQQPVHPIGQIRRSATGYLATIEMQPFVDRPGAETEHWSVTLTHADAETVSAIHPLIGRVTFRWADIRRLETDIFGSSFLLDARRFHLGNSIRPDFRRQRPDGTEVNAEVDLPTIPRGQAYFSLNVVEMEAARIDAPPASPYLAELRSGRLVTELFVNDQRVSDLNSLIRLKSSHKNPERVRLAIPRQFLKTGMNSLRLRQQPLTETRREFDDCEISVLRLEFALPE